MVSSVWVFATVLAGCGGLPFVTAEGPDVAVVGVEDGGGVTPVVAAADAADDGFDAAAGPLEASVSPTPTEAGGELDAGPQDPATDAGDVGAADPADAPCTLVEHPQGGYWSCDPLGTDSAEDALLACQAYATSASWPLSTCQTLSAGAACPSPHTPSVASLVCTTYGGSADECWGYDGAVKGDMLSAPGCNVLSTWD